MRSALLLFPVALALQACVYNSEVPLDDPAMAPFDERLLGDWLPAESDRAPASREDTLAALIHVERGEGNEYLVRREGEDEIRARAFVSDLDGTRFLNVIDLTEPEPLFSFARYTLRDGILELAFIADPDDEQGRGLGERYATSAALRDAVRARLDDPLLYGAEPVVLRRYPLEAGQR